MEVFYFFGNTINEFYHNNTIWYYIINLTIILVTTLPVYWNKKRSLLKKNIHFISLITPLIFINILLISIFNFDVKMAKVYDKDTKNIISVNNFLEKTNKKYNICIDKERVVNYKPIILTETNKDNLMYIHNERIYYKSLNNFSKEFTKMGNYFKICDNKSISDFYTKEEIKVWKDSLKYYVEEAKKNSNERFPIIMWVIKILPS